MSDFFVSNSGARHFVMNPQTEDICILDIAHCLSHVCRFGGNTRTHYSVAQHSLHVASLVPREHQLQALLHDATEAYLGDVIKPLKNQLPTYSDIEAVWWRVIAREFSIPEKLHHSVKSADLIALVTERRDLIPHPYKWKWNVDIPPDPAIIQPMSSAAAKVAFLERFWELR